MAIRAVVVDDDPDLRLLLRVQLEQAGDIEVVDEGDDGAKAIDLSERHHPDVLILDEAMPAGRSGIEVIPEVRAASPDTVVIVYTADSGTATRDRVIEAGGHAVVGKLDSVDLLVGTIHRLARHEAPAAGGTEEQFGDRMSELLHRDAQLRPPRQTLRDRGVRLWFVVVAVAGFPIAVAGVWFWALAAGWVHH